MKEHQDLMASNYQKAEPAATSRFLAADRPDQKGHFVNVQWLKAAIEAEEVAASPTEPMIILDVTRGVGDYQLDESRSEADYLAGHIPGALHFSTDELGEFKEYLHQPEVLRDQFLKYGVTAKSRLLLYSIYARDIMFIASRVAFAAYYLGVDEVYILDGGFQAWQRAGYALASGRQLPVAAETFGASVPKRPESYLRTPADVRAYQAEQPVSILASIRSWNEYSAQNAGHHWNKGVGDIAGALFAGDDFLTNELGELAHPQEYLPQWQSWGITPACDTIVYCGTSWRSATAFFIMLELGWTDLKLFDGSWFKWYLAHEEAPASYPIQIGDPANPDHFRIIDKYEG